MGVDAFSESFPVFEITFFETLADKSLGVGDDISGSFAEAFF